MLTPFISDIGLVDYECIPAHLRFLENHGIDGVLTLGTTGEGPSLGLSERQRVLDLVLSQRGRLTVIAGTGCAALSETVALSQYAVDHGADAILVMPPFYFKNGRPEGILNYYRALCDALPDNVRLLLYHIPAVTAVSITPLVIEGLLASHGHQFYGIKDSSSDIQHTTNLIRQYPQLQIFSGSDTQVANALAADAAGVISALSNVWPDLVRTVFDAHHSGRDVSTPQARLAAVRALIPNPTPPPLKAMLPWRSDLPRTSVRVPLTNLTDDETAQLRTALEVIDVL
jgi:4-hydroxy-tetrahydrodipicolinate synthase